MKRRTVDLAFTWMQGQPRRAYHYRQELWAALAELHPDDLAVTNQRKTPWFSLHRDMTQDSRFVRGDRGMFALASGQQFDGDLESTGNSVTSTRSDGGKPSLPGGRGRPATGMHTQGSGLTGTKARDWELATATEVFRANTWKDLVIRFARSCDETKLIALIGESAGRVPYVVDPVNVEPDRRKFYTTITPRVGVFHQVSAERAHIICAWLHRRVGGEGDVVLRSRSRGESGTIPVRSASEDNRTRRTRRAPRPVESATARNRRLLHHLGTFGELTLSDLGDLQLESDTLGDWLDSLLTRRPESYVVTPLFLHLIDGDLSPASFTTRLAAHFMGEHLRRHAPEAIPELEEHVWSRFGRWHMPQAHSGDEASLAYLSVPSCERREVAASERLDLFSRLPPQVIGNLIRETDFLAEQQSWSADAAVRSPEGPLSTQLRRKWRRPLLLSAVELPLADDGQVPIGRMDRPVVIERTYIVSGLPLCTADDWKPSATLQRDVAADRLCRHPVAAAIVQFEVHRLFAGLSGDPAAMLNASGGVAQVEVDGVPRGPLWRHLRMLLEGLGYRPAGTSTLDARWTSATEAMLKNLELLEVLVMQGDVFQLTEHQQSKVKAHPGHPQNRGEKPYRIRLSQHLSAVNGGEV